MPVSLILGVNGQDGSYLAEELVRRGHTVVGVGRKPTAGAFAPSERYRYRQLDLAESGSLSRLLAEIEPEQVFHLAAVHGAAGFSYEPVFQDALLVNVASVHTVLEYARTIRRDTVVLYASSSKVFGEPISGVIDEASPKRMSCLYSVSKLAAEGMIEQYRSRHGVRAGVLYFFNHESPRRGSGFLFPRLAKELKICAADPGHVFEVNTLDFYCDWGSAEEYMSLAADAAQKAPGEDFVIATGRTWLGREFVEAVWRSRGLDSERHVRESRPGGAPPPFFQARTDKLERFLDRKPMRSAVDVCLEMAV